MVYEVRTAIFLAIAGLLISLAAVATEAPEQSRPTPEVRLEGCGEIWLEGSDNLTLGEKLELFRRLSAHRELTVKQKDCILRMGDQLLNQQNRSRWKLASWLGNMGHAYCIPALLAVLRDETEDALLRADCVRALSRIADKRVVHPIIEALGDPNDDVAQAAYEQLRQICVPTALQAKVPQPPGTEPHIGWGDVLERRQEYRQKWLGWWEKHREELQFRRKVILSP